jgi:UDP-glucose 4-epimerase
MALNAAILGAGFIGRNFLRRVLGTGGNLYVLDHKECPAEFEGRLTWIKGDLSDEKAVSAVLQNADVVYHFISSTVPGDVTDEGGELIQNVVQTLGLLKSCVRERVRRVVFVSSASVYGMQDNLPIPETALTNPISSHGIHKLTIEKYLQLYQYQHGLDCKIMRLSNPYGPGQSITGRQGFIAIAIGRILAGEAVMVRGDGSTLRDYIYIDDVSEALHLMGTTQAGESVFNVGSGQGHTLNQIVSMIGELMGEPVRVEYAGSRFVDIPASVLDISKVNAVLGKSAGTSLRDGLARTLRFHGLRLAAWP